MRSAHFVFLSVALNVFAVHAVAQQTVVAGQNVNMVSGTEWPHGDPYLQRQNEPSIAVSSRNPFHLMAGSNDYRTVDLPGPQPGKASIGESWISAYFSTTGGGRWTSMLLPGYPQDTSALGLASPLRTALDGAGYEASADPVVRSGTHGLFYYSGIAFTRVDDPPSAGFVATYMDLNNDERKNSIGYVGTAVFDQNDDGTSFIDKPWIAVDKPRGGSQFRTMDVHTEDGVVSQTVECGKVYVAYARIQGDGTLAQSSQIMVSHSSDCAQTFSTPVQVSLPNTINQGASIAVEPFTGRVQVAWRQFENATLNCTYQPDYWRTESNAWPVDSLAIAGETYLSGNSAALFPGGQGQQGGIAWLVLRELVAAWLNSLSGADNGEVVDTMADAEEWLTQNPPGSQPGSDARREGNELRRLLRDFNQGRSGPVSCDEIVGDGSSELLSGLNPNAIMVVSSTDGGETFSAPVSVTGPEYAPFEQGTTEYSFRTAGYPTMTFDAEGRSYIAYSTRGMALTDSDPISGDARIVVTTSLDGSFWTPAHPIDEPTEPGHQIMPALEFSRGHIFLLYYDFRRDLSGIHERFIVDVSSDPTAPRHSTDVRVAVADAADVPVFTDYSVVNGGSTQTSRYPFLVLNDEFSQPFSQQTQFNLLNLPMFKGGTVPFFGDYIDLAALHFVSDGAGNWDFDTGSGAPIVHAVWTDNRDVLGPPDGDWTSYVPPGNTGGQPSLFDPTQTVPVCSAPVADRTRMRNQNVYTSRLTQGLAFALPGNNRPLGVIQRVFVGFVQNTTGEDKTFRLEILNQPPGGSASLDQFEPVPVTTKDIVVKANSSISQSIYVTSIDPDAAVDIGVVELDAVGTPLPGGLTAMSKINPDPSAPVPDAGNILAEEIYTPTIFNPAIFNPTIFNAALLGTEDVGIYSPTIFNPTIFNNPEADPVFLQAAIQSLALLNPTIFNPTIFNPTIFNPTIFNPTIFNPTIFNPTIFNPTIFNPTIFNPTIFNPTIFNPTIFNPTIFNPAIFNPTIFNPTIFNSSLVETSVVVQNTGNATAAYSLNLELEDLPEGFVYQTMIYRTYLVPTVNATADGCTVTEEVVQEPLVNEFAPNVAGDLFDPNSTSFYVAPGDEVIVTLRIVPDPAAPVVGDPTTIDTLDELDLSQSLVPQAVDTPSVMAGVTRPAPAITLAPSVVGDPLQVAKLLPDDGAAADEFGLSVAISGNTVLVGNWRDDDLGNDSGSAYIFERNGDRWVQTAKLLASDGSGNSWFGYAVALDGDTALISAALRQVAYVFVRSGGVWTQQAKLTPSVGGRSNFGTFVDLENNRAIIAAERSFDFGPDSGAAYYFDLTGASGTVTETARLLASDGAAGDQFGRDVAIEGLVALIGSPADGDNGPASGSAYLFDLTGATATINEVAKLLPTDGAAGEIFGVATDIDGSSAIVGAMLDDDNGALSGSAYLFDLTGATGIVNEVAKILPSDGAADDLFGATVHLRGDVAVIGAGRDDEDFVNQGSAYIFNVDFSSGTSTEVAKMLASDGESDFFGFGLDLDATDMVVGATRDDDNGVDSGSAYVFTLARILDVALTSTTLTIGGPSVSYVADLYNLAGETPPTSVAIQAFIRQPGANRGAGGFSVLCTLTPGQLPPGPCSTNHSIGASNSGAGTGTLVPGPATAIFQLQRQGAVLATFTRQITLINP